MHTIKFIATVDVYLCILILQIDIFIDGTRKNEIIGKEQLPTSKTSRPIKSVHSDPQQEPHGKNKPDQL